MDIGKTLFLDLQKNEKRWIYGLLLSYNQTIYKHLGVSGSDVDKIIVICFLR